MDEDRTQDKTGLGPGQNKTGIKTGRGTRYDKRMLLIDCMKEGAGVGAREREPRAV